MDKRIVFKKVTSLIMSLVMLLVLIPLVGRTVYAYQVPARGFVLDSDENSSVHAQFSADGKTLIISGYGQIDKAKWIRMARSISSDYYTENARGWAFGENFDIRFKSESKDKQIKLPKDSSLLFGNFDQQVYFGENGVDTSEVVSMRAMFYGMNNFNQEFDLDTSNVRDMSFIFNGAVNFNNGGKVLELDVSALEDDSSTKYREGLRGAFNGSSITKIKINAGTNRDIIASYAFSNAHELQELEFSGLITETIYDSFRNGNFVVENLSKSSKEVKTEGAAVKLLDNDSYKINLSKQDLINGFNLQADDDKDSDVVAKFSADRKTLNISGYGQIDKAKWIEMARLVSPDYYLKITRGWAFREDFDISFNSVSEDKQIKLPKDSSMLFGNFDQQVYFGENGVDTSEVVSMRAMFYGMNNFNQEFKLDTSNVRDMSLMFNGSINFNNGGKVLELDVSALKDDALTEAEEGLRSAFNGSAITRIKINAGGNRDIVARHTFSNARELQELEFSGLMVESIYDSFRNGDFVVENLSKADIEVKSEGSFIEISDNDSYKIYLK